MFLEPRPYLGAVRGAKTGGISPYTGLPAGLTQYASQTSVSALLQPNWA